MVRRFLLLSLSLFLWTPCRAQDQTRPFYYAGVVPALSDYDNCEGSRFDRMELGLQAYETGNRFQEKEPLNALKYYEAAYRLDPLNVKYGTAISIVKQTMARSLFCSALRKQIKKDLIGAIADYQEAIKVDNDPASHWYLATAYQAAGRVDEARSEFQKSAEKVYREGYQGYRDGYVYSRSSLSTPTSVGDFGSNQLFFAPGEGLSKGAMKPK